MNKDHFVKFVQFVAEVFSAQSNVFALVELGLLALVFPFALFPTPERFVALLAVPALWIARRVATRHPSASLRTGSLLATRHLLPRTPLDLPILLLVAMVLVSLYATYDIATSLPKIAGMVYGIGLYYAVVRACRTPRGWLLGLAAFVLAGVAVAGLGLVGTRWSDKFPALAPILDRLPARFTGLPGAEAGIHPNELGGALLWVIPVAIALALGGAWPRSKPSPENVHPALPVRSNIGKRGVRRSAFNVERYALIRLGLGLAAAFMAGVLILAQSRTGIAALGVTLLALALLGARPRHRLLVAGGMGLAGVAAGIALWPQFHERYAWLGWDAVYMLVPLADLDGRLELWSRAIYGIQDFAFTGMGMNTFRIVVHVLYPLFLIGPEADIGHAHNEFLQAALDLGIPGLIAFLGLYLGAAWMLVQVWRTSVERVLVLGLGGGLLAHALYGLTDAIALGAKPGVLWWMMLGLIAGLYRLVGEGPLAGEPVRGGQAPRSGAGTGPPIGTGRPRPPNHTDATPTTRRIFRTRMTPGERARE